MKREDRPFRRSLDEYPHDIFLYAAVVCGAVVVVFEVVWIGGMALGLW